MGKTGVKIVLAAIMLMIILSTFIAIAAKENNSSLKVEKAVYDSLKNGSGEARVIIIPKKTEISGLAVAAGGKEIKNNVNIKHEFSDGSFSAVISSSELEMLKQSGQIEQIVAVKKIIPFLYDTINITNASRVWSAVTNGTNITGAGETICVVDSGINYTHPDLGGCFGAGCKVIGGYDFADSDTNPIDFIDGDGVTHGTHVAGIIAANGTITGIAPGANLVAAKVFESSTGAGYTDYLIAAIDWCVGNASVYNISVITMSLGISVSYNSYCDGDYPELAGPINAAIAKNISVTVATGNYLGGAGINSPACIENATAVGAVNKTDSIIYNRNNITELLGIGVNINSTHGGTYDVLSGTSMATPHVAAAFALLGQFKRAETGQIMTPAEIQSVLNRTGVLASGQSLGLRRIDILSALRAIDATRPAAGLISPANNLESTNQNQTFACNASDNVYVVNLTLMIWNSTALYNSSTLAVNNAFGAKQWNLTSMPYDSYKWNCLAADSNLSAFASANRTLVLASLAVNLNSPANNSRITNATYEFSCNATAEESLANATFYLWNSTSLINTTEIKNISGTSNSSNFNITFAYEDNYKWNCLAKTTTNTARLHSSNYSFLYDEINPIIKINSPNISAKINPANITFDFNVTENSTTSCSLFVNNISVATLSNANLASNNSFSYNATRGQNTWYINCTDSFGQSNASAEQSLPIIYLSNSTFGGQTTNIAGAEISNITNLILEATSYGLINFTQEINLSAGADINSYVNISHNRIEVNSSALAVLNKTAIITFYNHGLTTPRVLRDGSLCSSPVCANGTNSNGNYSVTVNGFSVYELEETPASTPAGGTTGGGGSGGAEGMTYLVSNESFEAGFSKELAAKDSLKFYTNGKYQVIKIVSIGMDNIVVNISNNRQETITIGQILKIDINDDKYYDFKIELTGIANSKANVTLQKLYEFYSAEKAVNQTAITGKAAEEGQKETERAKPNANGKLFIYALILIVIFAVGIILATRKKKPHELKSKTK